MCTVLNTNQPLPHRLVLTDGFFDQPFVSKLHPGSGITLSLEPTFVIEENSGLASSTRRTALDIWEGLLPDGEPEKLAKILFCCDNPPGTEEYTGSLDPIGLVYPALAKSNYAGAYWPQSIERIGDEDILRWLEELIYLVPIGPRPAEYALLENANLTKETVKNLADASDACWQAILAQDAQAFGRSVTTSYQALVTIFPKMLNATVENAIAQYCDQALGWKVSGAGGGGYLILVSEEPIKEGIRIVARRS